MVGSPGQSVETLAEDLLFFAGVTATDGRNRSVYSAS